MDAAQALRDLTEISSQIQAAVLLDRSGELLASTGVDEARSRRLAEAARALLRETEEVRPASGQAGLRQLEAATLEGSVFVVRDEERVIAATTGAEPTVGLVFYDLKSCLRSAAAASGIGESTGGAGSPLHAPAGSAPGAARPPEARGEGEGRAAP